jgi:hypothetical protein
VLRGPSLPRVAARLRTTPADQPTQLLAVGLPRGVHLKLLSDLPAALPGQPAVGSAGRLNSLATEGVLLPAPS